MYHSVFFCPKGWTHHSLLLWLVAIWLNQKLQVSGGHSYIPFALAWSLQGSPDLKAAKEVADYLGTHHHEFHFTVHVIYKAQGWRLGFLRFRIQA
ncbi:putative asparagine synthase (glutamine-hydrolyzing) [Rosa chinensis]|uniref:Putative asparagine synthase (Glutamine-hydrolyzing) n=1 Tax=Rosa chinensis TaxID=74649 RepID=A0A2P6RQQ2_ROSCH|nr:putative asparagine synthase (glutamine-hydrolyzing) [Rosa chinensis]